MKIIILFIFFSFPLFGIGARPLGMGGAFVATADDIHSIFYNPAGIATINGPQASSMRVLNNRDDDSINFKEWVGFCLEMKEGGLAGSYLHNIEWHGYADLNHNGERDGNDPYLASDDDIFIITLAGYGEGRLRKTAFGVNVKRYSSVLLRSQGIKIGGPGFSKLSKKRSAISFDIGILHNISKNASIGFAIYSLNEEEFDFGNLNIDGNVYYVKIKHPLILTGGISLKLDDKSIVACDLYDVDNINDWYSQKEDDRGQSSVRFGFEREVLPNFVIRLGFGSGFHSAGFGIKTKGIIFDYGVMENRNGLSFHLLSLTIGK